MVGGWVVLAMIMMGPRIGRDSWRYGLERQG